MKEHMKRTTKILFGAAALTLSAMTAMAQNTDLSEKLAAIDTGEAASTGLSALTPGIYFGLDLNEGNTENLGFNLGLNASGEFAPGQEIIAAIDGIYAESTLDGLDSTTAEQVTGDFQYNNSNWVGEPWYAGLGANALYDAIAEVDYRVNVYPTLGRYLHKDDVWDLAVEAGPGYLVEKVADIENDGVTLRFAERYNRAISDTSKIFQSLEYIPEVEDFEDFLLNFNIGIETEIAGGYSVRVALKDRYDNTPAEGFDENDLNLVVGILRAL